MTNEVKLASAMSGLHAKLEATRRPHFSTLFRVAARLFFPLLFILPSTLSAATTVAFIADTGARSGFTSVLNLIKQEGADIVLVQGDLGYDDNEASTWEKLVNDVLGPDFPVLAVAGNHENFEWPLYQNLIKRRIERANGLSCSGEVGVKANCTFENIRVVQVATGIREVPGIADRDDYPGYIRAAFGDNANDNRWKLCTWHKNQNAMQVYQKGNSAGWGVYDACLDVGAMVASGHAHTYSRTHLMSDFSTQTVIDRGSDLLLGPGRSISVVSGLGGRDVRPQLNNGDWFASVYTSTQNATHGALICTFDTLTADCFFKAVDGTVPDRFKLRRTATDVEPQGPQPGTSAGFVFSRTDINEFRWIDTDSSGQLGSIWINRECAQRLGGVSKSGNWFDLLAEAPGFDTIENPCRPTIPAGGLNGFVFSRTDIDELRWIDTDDSGGLGSVWIDEACADRLNKSVTDSGDWFDLLETAPGFDTIASPCY